MILEPLSNQQVHFKVSNSKMAEIANLMFNQKNFLRKITLKLLTLILLLYFRNIISHIGVRLSRDEREEFTVSFPHATQKIIFLTLCQQKISTSMKKIDNSIAAATQILQHIAKKFLLASFAKMLPNAVQGKFDDFPL